MLPTNNILYSYYCSYVRMKVYMLLVITHVCLFHFSMSMYIEETCFLRGQQAIDIEIQPQNLTYILFQGRAVLLNFMSVSLDWTSFGKRPFKNLY